MVLKPIINFRSFEVVIRGIFLQNLRNVVFWNDVKKRHIYHSFTAISTHITLNPAVKHVFLTLAIALILKLHLYLHKETQNSEMTTQFYDEIGREPRLNTARLGGSGKGGDVITYLVYGSQDALFEDENSGLGRNITAWYDRS